VKFSSTNLSFGVIFFIFVLMGKEDRILSLLYPGREDWDSAERELARRIVSVVDGKTEKAAGLPTKFVELGGVAVVRGRRYRCVVRPRLHWTDCCSGCAFSGTDCPPFLQCGRHDRRDGLDVWFEEEG